MPNDYITYKALASELNCLLATGKIDKIFMPEKDEITLSIRANSVNYLLAISCNANNPRIHITSTKKLNPPNAPSFCMHLRKYLTGAIIDKICLIGEDRIFGIYVTGHNELRDEVQYCLIAEMMGRYSNILLCNNKETITDTLKQVAYDCVTKRCLLPSAKYEIPAQNKILLSNTTAIENCLCNYIGNNLPQFLCANLAGLSTQSAQEIAHLSNNPTAPLNSNQIISIVKNIQAMTTCYENNFSPCYTVNNSSKDFFAYPYHGINQPNLTATLNQAIEQCVSKADQQQRQQERTKELTKAYNSLLSRTRKKLEKNSSKLFEAQDLDKYKLFGDLLSANLHTINKGDKHIEVLNYYDNSMLTIPLNIQLSPQQNLQSFYKKYAKLKRTLAIVNQQSEQLKDQLDYLLTIQPSLNLCTTPDEIQEIIQELQDVGAIKKQVKTNKQKFKNGQPFTYLVEDFVICVGKNNLQNDKLTFKVANGNDIWIHTQKIHGSHTIIFAEGRPIPDSVLNIACEICAYYSQGTANTKVECDYTCRKNVKRHPSGKLGMVTYTDYKSVYVEPKQHLEYIEK